MSYLIDTNIISEIRKDGRCDQAPDYAALIRATLFAVRCALQGFSGGIRLWLAGGSEDHDKGVGWCVIAGCWCRGGSFFFTVVLADRRATTLTDHVGLLRAAFRKVRAKRRFGVEAAVVLPDHFHVVLSLPEGDRDFSTRLRLIKTEFTQGLVAKGVCPRLATGESAVWQSRFWEHCVRDERDFERHVDYVHFNPVKHGLVSRAVEWPFSSVHRLVRAGVVAADWGGDGVEMNGESLPG